MTARVALLTEIPAPFRIPLFNELAARPEVDLHVLFLSEQDPKRPYPAYTSEFAFAWSLLGGPELVRGGRWIVFSRRVRRTLRSLRPDVVVIGGWNQPAFWQAALYARLRHVPLVAWVESTARDARPGRAPTEWPKRALIRSCAAFLVPGRAAAEYLQALGVDPARISVAPNAVDNRIFGDRVDEARGRREELRTDLGLTRPTVLHVGRLDPEKGVDLLLEAVLGLDVDVVVAGRGLDAEALRARAAANVRFLGFVERDGLVPWYAAADIFVLAARSDQWGMVLNEAAAAGLPIVATEAPGAAHDLVDHGVSGYRVPVGDVAALREAIAALVADPALRARAGARSRELASAHTPAAWADAVAAVAQKLVG